VPGGRNLTVKRSLSPLVGVWLVIMSFAFYACDCISCNPFYIMSTAIVLPNLTNWAQQHLTTLLQATSQDDFNAAFDAFIAQDVAITVNGQTLTRDQYKQQISGEKFAEAGATVNFVGTVEVPTDPTQPVLAGSVGLFFNATIDEKFLVLGAPESSTINSSLNIVVIQDKTIPPPNLPGRGGFFDPRRVSVLDQVNVDKPNPVSLPTPPTTGN